MFKLKMIIASTRPGRQGISVADWFQKKMGDYPDFEVEVLDLAKINLPHIDEPEHPKLQHYTKSHTKEWSAKIEEADAFVCVISEYNYSMPPALLNAIDFVYKEWNYKPVGLVSYGGISGGLRSAQMCKLAMTTVKLVPLTEGVSLSFSAQRINEMGEFVSDERIDKTVKIMMVELLKWTKGLKYMRENIIG